MDYLLGDKGYDSNAVVAKVEAQGSKVVMPPRKKTSGPGVRQGSLQVALFGGEYLLAPQAVAGIAALCEESVVLRCRRSNSPSCTPASYLVTILSAF